VAPPCPAFVGCISGLGVSLARLLTLPQLPERDAGGLVSASRSGNLWRKPAAELLVHHLLNVVRRLTLAQPGQYRADLGIVLIRVGLEVEPNRIEAEEQCTRLLKEGFVLAFELGSLVLASCNFLRVHGSPSSDLCASTPNSLLDCVPLLHPTTSAESVRSRVRS
jgi:hypothetical protein